MKTSYKKYGIGGIAQSFGSPMIESGMQTVTGNWGGSPVSVFAKGGYTKRISDNDLYRFREKTKHERIDTEGVGNFELPKDKDTRYLYELDDFDRNLVKDIKLKPNEHIFRYETYSTKIGGYIPLVKINLDNQMVYFLTENAWDGGDIEFVKKGEKAQFINISDKYAKGGAVDKALDKTEKYWYERIKNSNSNSVSSYNLSTNDIVILNRLSSMGLVVKQVIKGTQEATYTLKEKFAKGGMFEVGDWVAEKKGTARGQVYKKLGSFIYLKDKYGNESQTLYSEDKFKKSVTPRYDDGGEVHRKEKIELMLDAYTDSTYFNSSYGTLRSGFKEVKVVVNMVLNEYGYAKMKGKYVVIDIENGQIEGRSNDKKIFNTKGEAVEYIEKNYSEEDEKYDDGGQAKISIANTDIKFDKSLYKGILDDYDLDGLPNADDPHPYSKKDKVSLEQTKLSTAVNNVINVKNKMDDELDVFVKKLQQVAPSDSKIYGRTKTPFSILNKLVNSRLLDQKRGLKDLVGTTVAFRNYQDLQNFKKRVDKGMFGKVVDFDNYYENPNDGYRAYHYIVEQDGTPIELQLKTDRMKEINVLSHDAYKNQILNKDYLLYLTTIANDADKGNTYSMEQFSEIMSNKVAVKKKLSSGK